MTATNPRVVRRRRAPLVASLTAAAAPVTDTSKMFTSSVGRNAEWQNDAWRFTRCIGELGYFVRWRSNACAQVRLVASEVDPDTGLPTGSVDPEDPEAQQFVELVKQIAGGPLGQKRLIKRSAACLTVPGEHWVCILQRPDGEQWYAVSKKQITTSTKPGCDTAIKLPDGTVHDFVKGKDAMFRVWNEDAEDPCLADSPVRACLDPLGEIERQTKKIKNADNSRMLNAGMLMVPSEASLPDTQAPKAADQPGATPTPAQQRRVAGSLQRMIIQAAEHSNRDENSMAALVPIVVAAPGEHIGKVAHIEFSKEASKTAVEIRDSAIGRVATGLDVTKERLLGMGENSNHWCVDDQTEALTQRGWVGEADLHVGDMVLTLNHTTGLSEWKPVLDIYRAGVTEEPMVQIDHTRMSSLTTMNHRWPTQHGKSRDWTTSGDILDHTRRLAEGQRGQGAQRTEKLFLAAPASDLPDAAKYSDALVELVAWYFTEGSHGVRTGRLTPQVTIYQSRRVNPDNCARIRRALTTLFGPESEKLDKGGRYSTQKSIERRARARELREQDWKIADIAAELAVSDTMIRNYLTRYAKTRDTTPRWRERDGGSDMADFVLNAAAAEVILEHAPNRAVTRDFISTLTEPQLRLFVDISVLADGHRNGDCYELVQKDPKRLDAFEYAGILLGYSARWSTMRGGMHKVSLSPGMTTFAPRGRHTTEAVYSGVVWCPTTENRTWMARRNGSTYFTGNSAYLLADEDVKLHVAPVMEVLCQAIYTCTLSNMLKDRGIDTTKYTLWFDTSQLTKDPDLTDEAKDAYGHGVTKSASYVKTLGLPANDLYDLTTEDGRAEWAWDRVSDDPNLLPLLGQMIPALAEYDFGSQAQATPPYDDYGNPIDTGETTDTSSDQSSGDQTSTDQTGYQTGVDVQEPATETNDPTTPTYSAETVALAVEDLLTNRALELAAKRRIPTSDRALHAKLRHVPTHERNRHLPAATPAEVQHLIRGWDDILTPEFAAARGLNYNRLHAAVSARVIAELTAAQVNGHATNGSTGTSSTLTSVGVSL